MMNRLLPIAYMSDCINTYGDRDAVAEDELPLGSGRADLCRIRCGFERVSVRMRAHGHLPIQVALMHRFIFQDACVCASSQER